MQLLSFTPGSSSPALATVFATFRSFLFVVRITASSLPGAGFTPLLVIITTVVGASLATALAGLAIVTTSFVIATVLPAATPILLFFIIIIVIVAEASSLLVGLVSSFLGVVSTRSLPSPSLLFLVVSVITALCARFGIYFRIAESVLA